MVEFWTLRAFLSSVLDKEKLAEHVMIMGLV